MDVGNLSLTCSHPINHILDVDLQTMNNQNILEASVIQTPLGPMLAIADHDALIFLHFITEEIKQKVKKLSSVTKSAILPGANDILRSAERELQSYFDGCLIEFKTPVKPVGTPFQQVVWRSLMEVPFGETRSYAAQAAAVGKSTAYRAVAGANGWNPILIIIPCHRVINSDKGLGGYNGGLDRKKWLLDHERMNA